MTAINFSNAPVSAADQRRLAYVALQPGRHKPVAATSRPNTAVAIGQTGRKNAQLVHRATVEMAGPLS
jgi:hypothetical protein